MDIASQHLTSGIGALSASEEKLRSFGYSLYLETKAKAWTKPRGFTFCGKGHAPSMPAVTMGVAIHRDDTNDKAVVFSILVAWDAVHWSVQSFVEDEDITRDEILAELWKSPEYTCATLDELLTCLDEATRLLISSAKDERVAAMLATVARCV